ncbi:galactan 5-O-arabinofuranosyltransferase [Corynebacterium choanae]|uniref:Galactan 5-O-arabinofuranosyltransferase n=1 Tax=Corynebacterium choanae TaxID=1862358 RepID=A0A3G6J9R0_9CORY|nr:galactan 5-O-arabinofuranosyltransferase [Corynebacterium choanae]AZA14649.1 Arabinofuranosyltransferase AftA [Corynebacterium choanae]
MSHPVASATTPPTVQLPVSDRQEYVTDLPGVGKTIASIIAAGLLGGCGTLLCWLVLQRTHLPAFGSSNVTRALATYGSVCVVLIVVALCWWWIADEHKDPAGDDPATFSDDFRFAPVRPRWRVWLTTGLCWLAPAGLVVTCLAIPLAATRLYLDGITVDQGFRTQFLTRLTDSWRLSDMNYIDMPSFYPAGWFWLGGRLGNLLGLPGWAVFQPWALVSMAAACSMLVPVWQRLTGSLPVAAAIALVSTAVVLVVSAEEPYAAIVAAGIPAATVLIRRAMEGHRAALVGLVLYLGASACMYTLYTAVMALSVMIFSVLFAVIVEKSLWPVLRMIVVGVASMAIAALVWAPYVLARYVTELPSSGATANHYLPFEGTVVPLPLFSFSAIGALCLLGTIYLVMRAYDPDVRAMGIALVVFYGWVLASMIITISGRTLLGFRMDAVITMQLVTAGVLALAELRLTGVSKLYPNRISTQLGRRITAVMMVLLALAGIGYVQLIPQKNAPGLDLAYTDTDGAGNRADRKPADAARYYSEIDAFLQNHGLSPASTVVLTDELNFLSYYPYRGFQAMTSHYANPLGEFDKRNEAIEQLALDSWGPLQQPAAFRTALSGLQWTAPQVMIFRGKIDDFDTGWKFDLAEDIYPNDPNVRFRGVYFSPAAFADGWDVSQIGPFVVAVAGT